ncbi:MAG: hypothetical protein H6684_02900 [Deltaproteobacteria bacterium]|nr:hypothetical protein [Deltaproteobacteria bacterium]MCB9478166.1 hypothetical protein [Deltaproteobacteria bacterium]MCB9487662.1 hypothetical protein [Deltaproteobacteria bacterium]
MNARKWWRRAALAAAFLAVAVVLPGCGCGDDDDDDDDDTVDVDDDDDDTVSVDDDDDDTGDDDTTDDDTTDDDTGDDDLTAEEWVDEGRRLLIAGEPAGARLAFDEALALEPGYGEAHYGRTLAGGLHTWELISLVSTYLAGDNVAPPEGLTAEVDPNRELLRGIIQILEDQYFGPVAGTTRASNDWLADNDDAPFLIDGVPVFLGLEPAAYLGSEFDAAERVAATGVTNIFDGSGGILLSMHLDFSFTYLTNLGYYLDQGDSTIETISIIVELLDRLLNDPSYPNFLGIDPDYFERIDQSRTYLGLGMLQLQQALDLVRAETDDQSDDVIGYADLNENEQWDSGEPFTLPTYGQFSEADMALVAGLEAMAQGWGAAFLEGTELDPDPENYNEMALALANPVLEALGISGFIPEGNLFTIDVASFFTDIQEDSIRGFLETFVNLLQIFLPDPPDGVFD